MIEKLLQIQTADGVMETFLAHPDDETGMPVVVLYMDAPGIREELYGFARRIAAEGYCCLLPDLYYRRGRIRMNLASMTAEQGREMFAHMRSLSNALVLADTEALIEALKSEPLAAEGPKGCIGYCMSGQYIMSVAGTFPEHFRASVSCYGVGIVSPSPTRLIGSPRMCRGRCSSPSPKRMNMFQTMSSRLCARHWTSIRSNLRSTPTREQNMASASPSAGGPTTRAPPKTYGVGALKCSSASSNSGAILIQSLGSPRSCCARGGGNEKEHMGEIRCGGHEDFAELI